MSTALPGLEALQAELAKIQATATEVVALVKTLQQPNTEDEAVASVATALDQVNTTLAAMLPPAAPATTEPAA